MVQNAFYHMMLTCLSCQRTDKRKGSTGRWKWCSRKFSTFCNNFDNIRFIWCNRYLNIYAHLLVKWAADHNFVGVLRQNIYPRSFFECWKEGLISFWVIGRLCFMYKLFFWFQWNFTFQQQKNKGFYKTKRTFFLI